MPVAGARCLSLSLAVSRCLSLSLAVSRCLSLTHSLSISPPRSLKNFGLPTRQIGEYGRACCRGVGHGVVPRGSDCPDVKRSALVGVKGGAAKDKPHGWPPPGWPGRGLIQKDCERGLRARTASEDCERGLLVDGVAGRVGALLLKPPVNSDQTPRNVESLAETKTARRSRDGARKSSKARSSSIK